MLTTDERLSSLEAGTVQAGNDLYEAATNADISKVTVNIRKRIIAIYQRMAALQHTLKVSEGICDKMEADLKAAGRIS